MGERWGGRADPLSRDLSFAPAQRGTTVAYCGILGTLHDYCTIGTLHNVHTAQTRLYYREHRLGALSAHIAHCLHCAHLHISHCKDQPRSGSCTAPVYCTNHAPHFRAPVQAYIAQIMIHLYVCLVLADFAYWRLHIAHITPCASHFCKLQCTFEKALICSIHTILNRH